MFLGVSIAVPWTTAAADTLTGEERGRYAQLAARSMSDFSSQDLGDYIRLRKKEQEGDPNGPLPVHEVRHFASRAVGTPYRLHAGRFDLTQADCVTFVERTIALGLARDFCTYQWLCDRLRHRNGSVDVLDRNFFTLADWVPNNSWLLRDITAELGAEPVSFDYVVFRRSFLRNVRYGLGSQPEAITAYEVQLGAFPTHEEAMEAVELYAAKGLPVIAERQPRGDRLLWIVLLQYPSHADAVAGLSQVRPIQPSAMLTERSKAAAKAAKIAAAPEKEVIEEHYVSRDDLPSVLHRLQSADVCLIIRSQQGSPGSKPSVYCDHMGILDISSEDGSVLLVHSSPPRVRADKLLDFLDRHRHIVGIKVLRMREDFEMPTMDGQDADAGAIKEVE